jgi:putative GTP pyrophosphokinase
MEQKEFVNLYNQEMPMYETWADFVCEEINSEIKSHCRDDKEYSEWIKIPPTKRVKTIDSLVSKVFVRHHEYYKGKNAYQEVTDKAGVRFVVLLTSQLSHVSKFIENSHSWTFEKSREFDDWKEKDPRLFDYQSVHYIVSCSSDVLHNDVVVKEGTTCEVQVRTLLQHAYAELAHDTIYKGNVKAEPEVVRSFAKSMALMETTDGLLCEAKATLDKASTYINQWKYIIKEETEKRLANLDVINDDSNNDFLIDNFVEFLKKHSIEEFSNFLEEYTYIPERIGIRIDQGLFLEFRQGYMLLVYFLVRKHRRSFHKSWPFDLRILEGVYSDLGLSPPWPTT